MIRIPAHLKKVLLCAGFALSLPATAALQAQIAAGIDDGPYVTHLAEGQVLVEGVCRSTVRSQLLSQPLVLRHPCSGEPVSILRRSFKAPEAAYQGVERILALSDVEGRYPALLKLLRNAGVIDQTNAWAYGKGHVVFNGDMVDRGDQVTEVLWFIHRLEQEAERAGGRVHFILGNHEKMALEGDVRYIHEKYEASTALLGRNYSELFAKNTELGAWLRTRNALVKINDTLFVHAGLQKSITGLGLELEEINSAIRLGFAQPELKKSDERVKWMLSSEGPLWYRGYFKDEELSTAEIDQSLGYFGVKRVAVGHTIVPEIAFLHRGRVLAIDTSFTTESKIAALVFEKGRFWSVNIQGERKAL